MIKIREERRGFEREIKECERMKRREDENTFCTRVVK